MGEVGTVERERVTVCAREGESGAGLGGAESKK